jgi:hypothetical protein
MSEEYVSLICGPWQFGKNPMYRQDHPDHPAMSTKQNICFADVGRCWRITRLTKEKNRAGPNLQHLPFGRGLTPVFLSMYSWYFPILPYAPIILFSVFSLWPLHFLRGSPLSLAPHGDYQCCG